MPTGLVGMVIAWASWDGARTGGRSSFFQIVLIAFGLHAIFHVAQSIVTRAYAPGVITASLIVAPYSWWAWPRVKHAGIANLGGGTSWVLAIVLFPPVVIGAHLIARGIDRAVDRALRQRGVYR
jgi:hypothetical protein